MNSEKLFDIIVVGGGPMGLATAYNCAKRGQNVLVLERFNFFNQSGSSNDLVRMFRTMYTEDFMADLTKASIDLWKELEMESGNQLILMNGLLNFGDPDYSMGPEGNLLDPIKNLERLQMPYQVLTAKEIMQQYPIKDIPGHFLGVYAPDNGCINVPLVLRSLYQLCIATGVKLLSQAAVLELLISENKVEVVADLGKPETFTCKRCIVTCGSYVNDVLASSGVQLDLKIWEMVYGYYATKPESPATSFPSMWFQFLDSTDDDSAQSNLFYGFPPVPWGPPDLARIAVDNAVNIISNPKDRQIIPSANDLMCTADFVKNHIKGVDYQPNYCGTCLQTNVADNMYVLDYLPPSVQGNRNVIVFTAGWAFKLVPLIGRILSQMALDGYTNYDITHYTITRPGILK